MNSAETSNFSNNVVRVLTSTALELGRRVEKGGGGGMRSWNYDVGGVDGRVSFWPASSNREPIDLRSSWNAFRSSQRLVRSRSMIRTNPWIGSGSGDSPPPSPSQPPSLPPPPPPPPMMCRSWSMVETGKTPTTTKAPPPLPPRVSTNRFNNEYPYSSNKYPMYSREDSLLTTSIETDSFCPSEFSDAETTTSLTSFGDVCLTPTDGDRRLSDVISYDPPTKITATSKRGVRSADGADYEGDRFLFEALNAESIRKMRKKRVNISSFSSSGVKQEPSVERSSEVNWEEKKSVQTKGDSNDVTHAQFSENTEMEIEKNRNFAQRTEHAGCSKVDELFCDSESKRANDSSLPRKILTIRSSLKDKVTLLKREKRVVDQKIREAKEEERIRIRELEKFRQQLAETRREILLRTLEDIKRTLALQVLRLQKVYDFVLMEQRQSFDCP